MTDQNYHDDSMLHAYIDGELDNTARNNLLIELEDNEELRTRICELRHTKEWVQSSFDGLTAPTQSLPGNTHHLFSMPILRLAASVLVIVAAFGAGWFGHLAQNNATPNFSQAAVTDPSHVILHIARSNNQEFTALLDKANRILQEYTELGAQVEVIANAGGLGMLQTSSQHVKRIEQMMDNYENVRFIACSKGLQKLREKGMNPVLVKGVYSDSTAGDHVIQRLQEGWTYIKI